MVKLRALAQCAAIGILAASNAEAAGSWTSFAGCKDGSSEVVLEYTASVFLNKKFLGHWPPTAGSVREAIVHQAKFLVNPGAFPSLVPSSEEPEIEILSESNAPYPLNITVDRIKHPWAQYPIPYLTNAVNYGFGFKTDPAREIRYRARMKAAHCKSANAPTEALPSRLGLPYDPYLSYWLVPSNQRRPLRYGQTFWVASPCATTEVVEVINPAEHWYVWDPKAKGTDEEGQAYDCSRILKAGTHFQEVDVKATTLPPLASAGAEKPAWASELAKQKGPIRLTGIFGIWKTQGAPLDTGKAAALFKGRSFEAGASEAFKQGGREVFQGDPGTVHFFHFLKGLSENVDVKKLVFEARGGAGAKPVVMKVEGTLKKSGKALQARIFYGITDYWRNGAHSETLNRALAEDDIIFYNGHSGMGGNLRLDRARELASRSRRKPYQLIGLLSCYSYRYYESEFLSLRRGSAGKEPLKTDIFTTATPYYSPRLLSLALRSIDEATAGAKPRLEDSWKTEIHRGHFLVVRRVEG